MTSLQKASTYAKALASIPLCLAYWGGWALAACVMGPIEEARREIRERRARP